MSKPTLLGSCLVFIAGCIGGIGQETAATESLTPPTAEALLRIVWLGRQHQGSVIPFGSGVIVSLDHGEYLVTAHHVAARCGFKPLVRFRDRWHALGWRVVADSETLDVTVLESDTKFISADNPLLVGYGTVEGLMHGQVGYALGFPRIADDSGFKLSHIAVLEGRPIPIPAMLVVNLPMPDVESAYSASYVNDGYSGGAIAARVAETGKWAILGIIKHAPTVDRPVLRPTADGNGKRVHVGTGEIVKQHAGLVGYTPWSRVEELLADARR